MRVLLAGVCATDLAMLQGYADGVGVLGHEFVGLVEQADSAPDWVGCRVVAEITVGCGVCAGCQQTGPGHCGQRRVLGIRQRDGVFAEWVVVPVANLHRVPVTMADRVAVFVEPLAAALEVVQQRHVRPTDRVVVLGAGKLGLLVAQVLALTGCVLTVVVREARPRPFLEARNILVERASGLTEWGWADLVVECSGTPEGWHLARRLVRPRGSIVLKSAYLSPVAVDLAALVVDEITLTGSRCGPFAAALRLLERRLVDVEPLIQAVYPLEQALEALQHAAVPGTLKILIEPCASSALP